MKKHDAVVIVPDEGYTVDIYRRAVEIYRQLVREKFVPLVIISGATRNPEKMKSYGMKKFLEKFFEIIPVRKQIEEIKMLGVPVADIFYESLSMNTRENAVNSLNIIKRYNIQAENIHLIGSFEVMLRKYLTFKKAAKDVNLNIKITIVPVFHSLPAKLLVARMIIVLGEFPRIIKYRKLGHI